MSRTAAEVEQSIERNRRELTAAIGDLRAGLDQGARQISDVKELATGARARLEKEVAERGDALRARLEAEVAARSDKLALGAVGTGFVVGGGVGGARNLPLKLVGFSRSRSEVVVRQDRHSRQVGRALAAVASADRQIRHRGGFGRRTLKRLTFVAPVVAGIAALVTERDDLPPALVEGREKVLDTIFT